MTLTETVELLAFMYSGSSLSGQIYRDLAERCAHGPEDLYGDFMLERFKASTGTQITHVPYKGSAPALIDIMANRIDGTIDTMPAVISQIRSGKMRALAVTGPRRVPQLPDVPTLAESGHADLVATSWFGIALPAATPPAVIQRLNREIYAVVDLPEVKARFDELSLAPVPMTAAETQRYIQNEIERWRPVVQAAGISFQ